MLRLSGRALFLVLPLTFASGCGDRAMGPTVDTPPVLVPTELRPVGAPQAEPVTVALVRCDDGGDAGGVIVDGVCI